MSGKKYILIDSTFWIDLISPKSNEVQEEAETKFELIQDHLWIVPMPTFYETMRTRFIKNEIGMKRLNELLKQPNIEILNDDNYREDSLEETLSKTNYLKRKISLVDMIIRNIVKDINVKVDFLVTDNERDFADVCAQRRIEII